MPSNFEKVKEFRTAFGRPNYTHPSTINLDKIRLHETLIDEEHREVIDELMLFMRGKGNIHNLSKELADLLYVVYDAAWSFGIPLDKVFEEVHKSNMSKLDADGNPVLRKDGKIIKSNLYRPADLSNIL